MQAITDLFTQNCNCYPLLLQKCSTIKNSQLSSRFLWKTSLLPCFSSHLIHCSVFKVQFPVPFETRCKRSISWTLSSILKSHRASIVLVEIVGIEPATSCLQGRRSPSWAISPYLHFRKVVGPSGLEPPTLRLSVVRSSQLSYGPITTKGVYPLN